MQITVDKGDALDLRIAAGAQLIFSEAFQAPQHADRVISLRAANEPSVAPAAPIGLAVPPFGEFWKGQGGYNAGLCRGVEGLGNGRMYYVVLAIEEVKLKWNAGLERARNLKIDGHSDFSVPFRREQSVMFGIAPELFKKEWHWSCEQHAGSSGSAWVQYFGNGYQGNGHKDDEYLVRFVRRVFI